METPEKMSEIKLKVMEAVQDDVNKGIVKIDSNFIRKIGCAPGDIVEIKGERFTAAIVDRAYPGDIGLNIIRMDGNIRRNAKTSIGEMVSVKKAEVKPAKKVIIAPANKGVIVKASPQLFKYGLLGKALIKGDVVSLGRVRRRMSQHEQQISDIFSMMENQFASFGFGDIKFVVVDTLPKKEILIVTEETEVEFNPHAVEMKEEEALNLGINYEDIGGLEEEIKKVREMVELPLKHPEIFEKLGIEPPKGVLLHGPPGTGKTLLAKAVANETNSHFILINGPEVISKFYGESEANLRKKFEEAEQNAPSIIFFDEIDAIATKREETKGDVEKRVVAQLLGLMDGMKNRGKVIVIAATNMPNLIDPALRRPGRFDREIEIGVPDKNGRLEILKIHTRDMPHKGTLHDNILRTAIIDEIEKKIISINSQVKSRGEKLQEFEEKKKKADENTLRQITDSLRNIPFEIEHFQADLIEIKGFFAELKNSQSKIGKIVEELRSIEEARSWYAKPHDPRKVELESRKSDYIKKLEKYELVVPILERASKLGKEKDLLDIAKITHGFVGADLSSLTKEAAMIVLRRILPDLKVKGIEEGQPIPPEILEKLVVRERDFLDALKEVRPSALREVMIEIPDVSWSDVGGLDDTKNKLKEAVEWRLKQPEVFKRMGIRAPRGVLLYGPPGTGKTMLAKAVAKESEANFILVNGPSLLSKWVGESEKAVREIFRKARQTSPTILFFDEIDALVPRRAGSSSNDGGSRSNDKIVNQMLTEMDGLTGLTDVVVIAATNRPDIMDPALLRPGRFDRIIYTPVPDLETRKKIFQVHLNPIPVAYETLGVSDLQDHPASYEKKSRKGLKSKSAQESQLVLKDVKDSKDILTDGSKEMSKDIKTDLVDSTPEQKEAFISLLAEKTEGYVGADIEAVTREAAMVSLRHNLHATKVTWSNFERALETIRASVDKDVEETYKELETYFVTARAKQIKEEKSGYFG